MKIAILLHSTTGNTRLVTRFAASYFKAVGHECTIYDIVKKKELPKLDDIDVLGLSCPTMYFRPTFAMERVVARLAVAENGPKPAFLLATCMGEPGAHFALLAEWLRYKNYITVGAKWVLAPSNWPTHIHACRSLRTTTPLGTYLNYVSRPLRPLWGTIWPYSIIPDEEDRHDLEDFLEELVESLLNSPLESAPSPGSLHRNLPTTSVSGRIFPREHLAKLDLKIDSTKCSRCGTCILVCPVDAVTRESEEHIPIFRRGCTGCFTCFNRCPDGAISCIGTPAGSGRYHGPPRSMKEIFRTV